MTKRPLSFQTSKFSGFQMVKFIHCVVYFHADVATHHSKSCCDRLAEAGAVTKILNLIQTINRSPPHEQVLKHALTILKNLAHHLHLRLRIAEAPGAISIITEQLHMFRYFTESKASLILMPKLFSSLRFSMIGGASNCGNKQLQNLTRRGR